MRYFTQFASCLLLAQQAFSSASFSHETNAPPILTQRGVAGLRRAPLSESAPPGPQFTIDQIDIKFMIQYKCSRPEESRCLFYTSQQSQAAKNLVRRRNPLDLDTTIWTHWPEEFYNYKQGRFVSLLWAVPKLIAKEITYDEYRVTDTYRYFEMMSQALAFMTSGKAYVLTPDVKNIPTDGIWHEIERRTLMRPIRGDLPQDYGKCTEIIAIEPDGSNPTSIWTRPNRDKKRDVAFSPPGCPNPCPPWSAELEAMWEGWIW